MIDVETDDIPASIKIDEESFGDFSRRRSGRGNQLDIASFSNSWSQPEFTLIPSHWGMSGFVPERWSPLTRRSLDIRPRVD